MEYIVEQKEDFSHIAKEFITALTGRTGATLVTLSGELGAGKTTFSQQIGKILGVSEVMSSPTFVVEKIYTLPKDAPFKRLIHIDAYRLKEGRELSVLGINEILSEQGNLILLEWPENVRDILPVPASEVKIEVQEDGTRKVLIHENK